MMLSIDPILSSNDAADTANTAEPRRLYTFAIIRSSVKSAAVVTKKNRVAFATAAFRSCLTGRNQPDREIQNL